MANNPLPVIRSEEDRLYWRTLHTHTRGIWEALKARCIEPRGNAQNVAYDALAIVHAMAHCTLEAESASSVSLCPIQLDDEVLDASYRAVAPEEAE